MSVWRWLSTPAEPRSRYALLVGVFTFILMLVSAPVWSGGGFMAGGLAGGMSGGIAGIAAKLWMERRK